MNMCYMILVGGLEHKLYDFPYIGNLIIPTDELHHFSEGQANHQPECLGLQIFKKNPFETPPPAQLAKSWMATRNPAPAESGAKHSIILDGFQPSVWWCRISQPSTVLYTVLLISQIGKFDPFLFTDYYNSYFKNAGYNMV